MLRRSALFALLAIALISARGEGGEPTQYPLWHALATKAISARARSTDGADRAELLLTNATKGPIVLDVNGGMIIPVKTTAKADPSAPSREAQLWANPKTREKKVAPDFDQTQPLGIGLIADKGGKTTIELGPGETAKVAVLTVCLNSQVPAPHDLTPLVLAAEPAPEKARVVLRAWRDDPKRAHNLVQGDVWSKAEPCYAFEEERPPEKVAVAPPPASKERKPTETGLPANTVQVLAVKGEIAVLTSSGELSVGPARDTLRQVAADARGIYAESKTLHVLFEKSPLSGRPAVARYDVEKKKFTGELGAVGTRLLWACPDAVVVERDGDALLVDRETERRLASAAALTLVETSKGAVFLAPSDHPGDTRVVRLERVGRRVDVKRSAVAARFTSACALGDRVLATDATGALHQLRSDGLRPMRVGELLGESYANALVRRVVAAKSGVLLETEDSFVLQRSGSAPLPVGADPAASFFRDSATGDLYGVCGRSLRWWDDGRSGWIDVRVE